MSLKILQRSISLIGIIISLIFIFLSIHSYFIVKKADFYFSLSLFFFSSICLIIFILFFFRKIRFLNFSQNNNGFRLNILIGFCSVIISIAWFLSTFSSLIKDRGYSDFIGILFFGLGGIALIINGVKHNKKS